MTIRRVPRITNASKYFDLHKKVKNLKKHGQYVLWFYNGTDLKEERQRISSNIRYHCKPPEGFHYKFRCVVEEKTRQTAIAIFLVEVA